MPDSPTTETETITETEVNLEGDFPIPPETPPETEDEEEEEDEGEEETDESEEEESDEDEEVATPPEDTEEIDPNNNLLLLIARDRLDRKKQLHVDAVWEYLELLNMSNYIDEQEYRSQAMFVRELHTFRKNIENLFQPSQEAKSDASTIGRMIEKTEANIKEAETEGKSALEIDPMKGEIATMEEERTKQQDIFKRHMRNITKLLGEYDFVLKQV